MSIWYNKALSISDLKDIGRNTMGEHLGIVFTELGDDFLKATMPVDHAPNSHMVYCTAAHRLHWPKHLAA